MPHLIHRSNSFDDMGDCRERNHPASRKVGRPQFYVVCTIVLRLPTVEAGNVPGLQALQDTTSGGSQPSTASTWARLRTTPPQSNGGPLSIVRHFPFFSLEYQHRWNGSRRNVRSWTKMMSSLVILRWRSLAHSDRKDHFFSCSKILCCELQLN